MRSGFSARPTYEEQLMEDALWDRYCYQHDRAMARLLFLAHVWERNNAEELEERKKENG